MIRTLSIEHFRGVSQAKIEGLSQVNLFFGKNNCGKSSVLEALRLLTSSSPITAIALNKTRGYADYDNNALAMDFHNTDIQQPIRIAADNRELRITLFASETENIPLNSENDIMKETTTYGLSFDYTTNGKEYHSRLSLTDGSETAAIKKDEQMKQDITSVYLPPAYMQVDNTDALAELLKSKSEGSVVRILQTIEPKIQKISLIKKNILVDIGLQRLVPINLMGDGIKKYLAVILAIISCKDGMIMIDEIDNGFHHSMMPNLWNTVLQTAKEYNVQVFATTHNIDSLKGLSYTLTAEPSYQPLVSAFKLIKQEGDSLAALKYDYDQLSFSIEQEFEIR